MTLSLALRSIARVVITAPTACPWLRIGSAVEAWRGRDGDAGGDPAPLQGDRDRPKALQLPGLRADHATAGALPRGPARAPPRPTAPRHDPVRQVRPAPAVE